MTDTSTPSWAAAERWELGDVVRDADDDADTRSWAYVPEDEDDDAPWARLFDSLLGYDPDRDGRDEMPRRLELLVRRGRQAESGAGDE